MSQRKVKKIKKEIRRQVKRDNRALLADLEKLPLEYRLRICWKLSPGLKVVAVLFVPTLLIALWKIVELVRW